MSTKTVKRYVGRVRDTGKKPLHGGKAFRVKTRTNPAGQFGTRAWAEDAIEAAMGHDPSLVRVGVALENVEVDVKDRWQDHLLGDVKNPVTVPREYRAAYVDTLERATAAAIEYGSPIYVSESFRSRNEQEHFWAIYQAGGPIAARPGTSPHEHGIALDIPNARTNPKLIKALRRQKLLDDVASEKWHVTNHGYAG